MSILQHTDAINAAPDLQVWNNAAFDNRDSWSINLPESTAFQSSKENLSPTCTQENFPLRSSTPFKPLQQNEATGRSQGKPLKVLFKEGMLLLSPTPSDAENEVNSATRNIDTEIEDIELEISRLTSKLEALRLEKGKKNLKTIERGERTVPAKLAEEKQSTKNSKFTTTEMVEPPATMTGTKFRRRGMTLGPSEIAAGIRSRQMNKLEITPIQSTQNRRKSCFWKLEGIKEVEVRKGRRSLSSSPKSRSSVSKIQASKQALTTVGSKKSVKRDESLMSSIQPKNLFEEGEKPVASKKTLKPGRIVPSRYNQTSSQATRDPIKPDQRNRLLPENYKEDSKRCDKKRASIGKSLGSQAEQGQHQANEHRLKKSWETPSDAATDRRKSSVNRSQLSVLKIADLLPRIRTTQCIEESPRDSGPAKRVSDLNGERSYFNADESEVETSVCKAINFD